MGETKRNEIEREMRQMGKTGLCIGHAYAMVLKAADPIAADRAKRYIWSRIKQNQASDWGTVR